MTAKQLFLHSKLLRRLTLMMVAGTTVALCACSSGVKLATSMKTQKNNSTNSGSVDNRYANQPWNDPKSPIYNKSFYFDFDSYTVRKSDQALIEAHAKFLKANKNYRIIIQGNTDDVGTTEYNLALGQRRSEAVRKMLSLFRCARCTNGSGKFS
jgi:peptidoglycan-associated lipoprotein